MRRSVTILGATGSVGGSTLDLVEREPERFEVIALTANCDVEKLAAAAIRTGARHAVVADESCLPALRARLAGTGIAAAGGPRAVCEAARMGADWTMAAIVGLAGLGSAMAAIEGGGTVVLANKEPLVSAGDLVTAAARRHGATILPADSEHNAIYQCFDFARPERVRRIILTASGGPFRDWDVAAMRGVTPAQACAHPNWSMGAKISVDSATMMNKGLELIEAARLLPVANEALEILVHRQSPLDGGICRRFGARADGPVGHARADRAHARLARPDGDADAAARLCGDGKAGLRGARSRALPGIAAGARGAGGRGRPPGDPECRQ